MAYELPVVEVLTPPASEPVTLDAFKAHLRYNLGTAEDTLLAGYLASARELFEIRARRPVMPTAYRQWLTCLNGPVTLARGPLLGVQQVKYYDAAGTLQTLAGWSLDSAELPAVVYLPSATYPALDPTRRRPAYVDFTAGWADAASVPKAVVTAITLLAAHYYRFRETTAEVDPKELPYGFRAVCDLYSTGLNWGA